MKFKLKSFLLFVIVLSVSCNEPEEVSLSNESAIITFQILDYQQGPAAIDNVSKTIGVTVSSDAPINSLISSFTISDKASINVNGTNQESGLTSNDFTNPVIYTVTGEDGTTQTDWEVTINVLPESPFTVATLVADFPGNDGISVDSEGNLFVNSNGFVNMWNGTTIYKVTPDGTYSLFQDDLPSWPVGSIFDADENLYVTGWKAPGVITKISHDGSTNEVFYSGIGEPSGLEIDNSGNVYVMEPPSNRMIKITPLGVRTNFATGPSFNKSSGITFDKVNEVFYVTNWSNGAVSKVNLSGEVSPFVTLPVNNLGPIIIVDNYLYVTNPNGNRIYRVNVDTKVYEKIAGTGANGNNDGDGEVATFSFPLGVAVSNNKSTLYISEVAPSGNGRLRTITIN